MGILTPRSDPTSERPAPSWLSTLSRALVPLALAITAAGCVSSEGDVLSSGAADGGQGDGGGAADADDGCAQAPTCPAPPLGDITVCGQAVDLETSLPVTVNAPDVRVFDLVELRTDPLNASELARVTPDECGFYSTTVDGSTGLVVIFTGDDDSGFIRAASPVLSAPGQVVRSNAWLLRDEVDAQWSSDASITGTFASLGSVISIFVDVTRPPVGPLQGTPVSGVTISSSTPGTPDDFYFDDTGSLQRSSISSAQAATGANGSAVVRAPIQLSTYGGTKVGCNFGNAQGLGIPRVVQVQEISGTCN